MSTTYTTVCDRCGMRMENAEATPTVQLEFYDSDRRRQIERTDLCKSCVTKMRAFIEGADVEAFPLDADERALLYRGLECLREMLIGAAGLGSSPDRKMLDKIIKLRNRVIR